LYRSAYINLTGGLHEAPEFLAAYLPPAYGQALALLDPISVRQS
jgi:hypothetical protein